MELRRFVLADVMCLLVVLLAAAGARFWYLYDQADQARTAPAQVQGPDAGEGDGLVENLRGHRWFGGLAPLADTEERTAHTSPGYPWLLSLVARFTTEDGKPEDWKPLVRWAQGGLGALTAAFYFLFARRAFRSLLVGILAGLFCAVYPFWIINTAEINDGVLATFLLAGCLFLGTRGSQVGGPASSLFFGLGLAALSLVRAALLPFAVVAMLWFLLRCRTVKRGWLCALLAFLGLVNGLVPWALSNFQTFGEVVPIVDSTYLHLWIGNNSKAEGGPLDPVEMPARLAADLEGLGYEASAAGTVAEWKKLKQTERYHKLARVVLDNVKDDPVATVQRRLSAGLFFVFGANWFTPEHRLSSGSDRYSGILSGTLLALMVLTILGWRWTYSWRHLSKLAALAVVWIPLPYLLSHAEALSGPRLPLDGVMLCYAAFAVAYMLPRIGHPLRQGPQALSE